MLSNSFQERDQQIEEHHSNTSYFNILLLNHRDTMTRISSIWVSMQNTNNKILTSVPRHFFIFFQSSCIEPTSDFTEVLQASNNVTHHYALAFCLVLSAIQIQCFQMKSVCVHMHAHIYVCKSKPFIKARNT